MALGDGVLEGAGVGPTLPLDVASNLLRQPTTPPVDPASYQDAVQQAHFRANLPNFFNQFLDTVSAHRQAQVNADQEVAANDQTSEAQTAAATPLPDGTLPQQAQLQQPQLQSAQEQQSGTSPVPTTPAAPVTTPSVTVNSGSLSEAQRIAQNIQAVTAKASAPGQADMAALQANPALANIQKVQAAGVKPPQDSTGSLLSSLADVGHGIVHGAEGVLSPPTPENIKNNLGNALSTFHTAMGIPAEAFLALPAKPFEESIRQLTGYTGPLDTSGTLGEAMQKDPNSLNIGPLSVKESTVGQFAGSTAAYAPLVAIGGAMGVAPKVMDALFAGDALIATKPILDAYQRGELSGKDAIKEALTAAGPQLIMAGVGHLRGTEADVNAVPTAEEPFKNPGAMPEIPQTRADAANSNVADILATKAEARSSSPEDLQMMARRAGLNRMHEELAIDQNQMINERPQTPMDVRMDRHVLEGPNGAMLDYRGTHINDVNAGEVQGQGTGTALLNKAVNQIRAENPGATITADLNSEGGARLFARLPESQFFTRTGEPLSAADAIASAARLEGPTVEVRPAATAESNVQQPVTASVSATSPIDEQIRVRENQVSTLDMKIDRLVGSGEYDNTHPRIVKLEARASALQQEIENLQTQRKSAVSSMSTEDLVSSVQKQDEAIQAGVKHQLPGLNPNELSNEQTELRQRFNNGDLVAEKYFRSQLQPIEPVAPAAFNPREQVAAGELGAISPGSGKGPRATVQSVAPAEAVAPVAPAEAAKPVESVIPSGNETGTTTTTPAQGQLFPPETMQRLTTVTNHLESVGEPEVAQAIKNLNEPEAGAAGAAGAAGTAGGAGGAGAGTPPTTVNPAGGNPRAKVVPSKTTPMSPVVKVVRELGRQIGIERAPLVIQNVIKTALRNDAASLSEADVVGRKFANMRVNLGEFKPDLSAMPDAAQEILKTKPDAAEAMAIANPWQFDLTPVQQNYIKQFQDMIKQSGKRSMKAGVKFGEQTDDTNYYPRITVGADGKPVVTAAGSYLKGRTTGPLEDYLGKNDLVTDSSMALQAHLESAAMTRIKQEVLSNMRKVGNFDGQGKPLVYGSANGVHGYSPVDGMSTPDKFGRMWLARDGEVHELMTNTYSHGLGDVARLATAPSRVARSLQFMVGGFHAAFGNISLGVTDFPTLFRTLPQEVLKTATEGGRAAYRDENIESTLLGQHAGLKMPNVDTFGGARREIRQAQGIPEAKNTVRRVPGLGKFSQWNHDWLFQGVMPIVQLESFKSGVRWLMAHKPDLMPDNFDNVMASKNSDQIKLMLDKNPTFKTALEDVAARSNHSMGFTESTLGPGEKGLASGLFNTPTITRAIAANVRDTFLPPGNIRGGLARRWWGSTAVGFATIAVAGTALAFKGDYQRAYNEGYLDPHSPKFVLNPNNGKYFMSIALPSGTTVSLLSAPIRTPLRIMMAVPTTAASDIAAGESPLTTAKETGMAALQGVGGFYQPRLARGITAAGPALTAAAQNKPKDLLGVATSYAGGATPIVGSTLITKPPTDIATAKEDITSGLGTATGAQITQATAYTNYDGYLKSLRNPDGTQRFPEGASTQANLTNGLADLQANDPKLQQLKQEWDQSRLDNGSANSKQSLQIQQARDAQLKQAQVTFNKDGDYLAFRNAVSKIRSAAADADKQLTLSTAASTPERALINSWYDTFAKATDSTGSLHTSEYTDPVTGVTLPGLDELQAQWKTAHPGQYESVIQSVYEGSVPASSTERMLRVDRDKLTNSGWWQTGTNAWTTLQQRAQQYAPQLHLEQYQTYADYVKQQAASMEQQAQARGYDVDNARLIAGQLLRKNAIISDYGKIRTQLRLKVVRDNPGVAQILKKWGYGNPTTAETRIAVQQTQPLNSSGVPMAPTVPTQ